MFVIEDQSHSELMGEFSLLSDAIAELERLSKIPWGEPNVAPCTTGINCRRDYQIIEFDSSSNPWELKRQCGGLEISRQGLKWSLADNGNS